MAKAGTKSGPRRGGGFYQRVLSREERDLLPAASEIDGLGDEISVLRLKVRNVLATVAEGDDEGGLERAKLLIRYLGVLNQLTITNYRITQRSRKDLGDSIAAVLQGVRAELGIGEDDAPGD